MELGANNQSVYQLCRESDSARHTNKAFYFFDYMLIYVITKQIYNLEIPFVTTTSRKKFVFLVGLSHKPSTRTYFDFLVWASAILFN